MIYALLFLILICIGLGLLAYRQSQALDDLSDKYLDAEERAEAAAKSCEDKLEAIKANTRKRGL